MCGRYALAWRPREIRQHLIGADMQVEFNHNGDESDEDDEDDAQARQSYNVAPGYYEPVYRAYIEGDRYDPNNDNAGEGGSGGAHDSADSTTDAADTTQEPTTTTNATDGIERPKGAVKYTLQPMKWGLIPSWTKRNPDYPSLLKTINARDDTLALSTGLWTSMKHTKRCIIPAQGFYEWLKKGKDKVPHFTTRADGQLLLMAGLWDSVRYDGEDGKRHYTYTIITTSSSKQLSFLHDRMPVIFDPGSKEIEEWLDPHRRWDQGLQNLLRPYEKNGLICYPVKKEVGKVGNDSPSFIIPLDDKTNKSNIKNLFASASKPSKNGDERETRDDPAIHALDPETSAPLPVPKEASPTPSPTKSVPTTPAFARNKKRKLDDLSPATSLPPREDQLYSSSPVKTPSPLKKYSSTETGGGPKKGVFESPMKKRAKGKIIMAGEMGNKDITSFFGSK